MKSTLIRQEVIPFLVMIGSFVLSAIVLDAVFHQFDIVWVGRWLGIPGTVLILSSFAYSLRKRKIINTGKPKTFLTAHQVQTWIGALLILMHAGIHMYSIIPWLALFAMLLNIISGMTGTYLLKRSREYLVDKRSAYAGQGKTEEEIEEAVFHDAVVFGLMKKWRAVHLPITIIFAALGLIHIGSILLFWQWK
jgi:hypothetical protein